MSTVVAVVLGVCVLAIGGCFMSRSEKRRVEEIFAGRESLTPEEFFARYFAAAGVPEYIALGVREILQEHLGTDLSRLSAEDDFSGNLKEFFAQDSLVDVEIVYALEERFGIKISNEEAAAMHSIRDIVSTVHRKGMSA